MEILRELRINLGWTIQKLVQENGMICQTLSSAEKRISALADALSRRYGREIKPLDIDSLRIL